MHRLFKIRKEEFKNFLPFFILNLIMTMGFFVGRTTKDALFFSNAGAEYLPWAFIINAVVIFIFNSFLVSLMNRYSTSKMIIWSFVFSFICIIIFGFIFQMNLQMPIVLLVNFSFFLFFEIPYLLLIALFWDFTGTYFSPREADEMFPKITGGGHLGTTIAGFITIFLPSFIGGTNALIFIWGIIFLFCLFIIIWILKKRKPLSSYILEGDNIAENANVEESKENFLSGLMTLMKHPYALTFAFITFCTFFVMSIYDFSLAETSKSVLDTDTEKLTLYLGYIIMIFGAVAFFIQLFFVPFLIKKFSVENVNLIAPSLLTLGSTLLLASFTFITSAIARFFFLVNEFVFNQSLLPFIYGAVPEKDRNQVRSMIEGTIMNAALGIAGFFLLLPNLLKQFHIIFQSHWFGMAAFFSSILMLILSFKLRSQYIEILKERFDPEDSIGRKQFLFRLETLDHKDLITQLKRDLTSETEPIILMALDFIRQKRLNDLFDDICALADNQILIIRLEAIKTIRSIIREKMEFDQFIKSIRVKDNASKRPVFKKADYQTIEQIGNVYIHSGFSTQLGDDFVYLLKTPSIDSYVRGLATKFIFKSGSITAMKNALQIVEQSLKSSEKDDIIVANSVLSEMGGHADEHFSKIKEWLKHDSLEIVTIAYQSIIKIGKLHTVHAEKVFSVIIDNFNNEQLYELSINGAKEIIKSNESLISKIENYWKENEKALSIFDTLNGIVPNLPIMLSENDCEASEKLLVDMFLFSEHQTTQRACTVLETILKKRGKGLLTSNAQKIIESRTQNVNRLAIIVLLNQQLNKQHPRYEIAKLALTYRIDELFEQYLLCLWFGIRNKGNAKRIDLIFIDIKSKDVMTRDTAIKDLELELSNKRDIYLQFSDLMDVFDHRADIKKSLINFVNASYSEYHNKSWQELISLYFEIKKDTWLEWCLNKSPKIFKPNESAESIDEKMFEDGILALSKTSPFQNISLDIIAHFLLKSKIKVFNKEDRILYEGLANQGMYIVVNGEVEILSGNERKYSPPCPYVIGQIETISDQPFDISLRTTKNNTKAFYITNNIIENWVKTFPKASIKIAKNMVAGINSLNKKNIESDSAKRMKETNKLLYDIDFNLNKILSSSKRKQKKLKQQKRFLIKPFVLETILDKVNKSQLEQYYVIIDKDKELRVRCRDNKEYTMTLKDRSQENSLPISVKISKNIYNELQSYMIGRLIKKDRYQFKEDSYLGWSCDIYDENSQFNGMIVAEIDVEDDQSIPELPNELKIQEDISKFSDFENRNLALHGPPDFMYISGLKGKSKYHY